MQDLETPAVSSSADGICAWAWNVFPSAEKRQYDLKDHRAPASKSAGYTPHYIATTGKQKWTIQAKHENCLWN